MNTQAQISSSAVVSPGATPTAAPKGWFSRNWKWLVPTLVMFFFILPLAFLRSIFAAMPATEQAGVIQTQDTTTSGIVAELTDCRRKEGVLTIKVRFRNTSNKPANLTLTHYMKAGEDDPKFYVTAGNKKYFMLKDTEGTYLTSNSANDTFGVELKLEPGQTFLWWAKYPAPSADAKKINFMMPVTPPFEDVPITDK
jgi:hypothetical protein